MNLLFSIMLNSIVPLSGLQNALTIYCHENGYYNIYQSDRYGFNNPDMEWDGKEIEYLLIGDSFTEAVGVDWDDSYAGILFNRLENRGIEILNAGVIRYSPRIYYLKTEHLLNIRKLRFDELIVFIDTFDWP